MSRSRIFRLHGDDTFYRFLSKIILSILSCRHDIHQLNIYVNMQLINVNILMVTTCTLKMNFIHCLFIISFRPVREYLTHIRTSQFPMKGCNSTALEEGVSLQCYIFYHLKTRNLTLIFDKYWKRACPHNHDALFIYIFPIFYGSVLACIQRFEHIFMP